MIEVLEDVKDSRYEDEADNDKEDNYEILEFSGLTVKLKRHGCFKPKMANKQLQTFHFRI